jgi:uncharacterized damage-inducible protein DinB
MDKTGKILAAVPDGDVEFKPHAKSMKVGRLAGHIATLAGWPAVIIEQDVTEVKQLPDYSMEAGGLPALLAKFEENVARAQAALASVTEERLAEEWKLVFKEHTLLQMPRSYALVDVCKNHLVHHRGQLTVYLRLLGAKVPGVYGPSADEQQGM